ncbi:MAG TPA: nuclear transport factor 2 family protein [Leptolyngbyaceae cyanobacterium M33_DOE_097]|uniref:Nuclear transport factor 2 family protein n=1 Tax=Oscillatoriales cyanobacterium SpSt-418 TaxID=2282169 RepID=A0A7C3PC05_9CYAN|nr:nuclear transport factor 2 family protein [Leptolyngbyaceae cyanobacterium M33_DOE_097]
MQTHLLETSNCFSTDAAVKINGIQHSVVLDYFRHLNTGDFAATAALFAEDGFLHPPFESPVIGRGAIATYLEREAQDLQLQPLRGHSEQLPNGCTDFDIVGKVQTPWFSVNVAWQMILSPHDEIYVVRVKLLASLLELANLRDKRPTP